MQTPTPHLQLPFQFNTNKLVDDLALVLDGNWVSHFNTAGYDGDWKVISLYAPNGDAANIFAHSLDDSEMVETEVLKKCAYFKEVIATFKCEILTARILRLGVGAEIKPHRDHELGYEDGCFRLHIPIVTNPGVQFILDGTQVTMAPGECWYTNVNYVHSVKNEGAIDRVHLVIDGKRNQWSDELFFSLAPAASFEAQPQEVEDPETLQRMIQELSYSDLPAAKELMKELQKKLDK